jgi:hypothetical protein
MLLAAAGLPGTIVGSPTNAILALKRFSVNSMRVYPLFAQTMTLRFTPYSGAHSSDAAFRRL